MSRYLKVAAIITVCLMSVLALPGQSSAETGRWEQELSGEGWRLWLDHEADWTGDNLFLPPVDIDAIPANPPTVGWQGLRESEARAVEVPGTVEGYFWSANGNPNGIAGDYRGVSWWSTTFTINPSHKGKRITLAFESVNLRGEVYLNNRLVGYDVIGNTPFEVVITEGVRFNGPNTLDVRITDPVGTFDWNDENLLRWGSNWVPSVHGFGGITGCVFLRATNVVHIDDVYVQNKPDITAVDVFVNTGNSTTSSYEGNMTLLIHEWRQPSRVLWKKTVPITVPPGGKDIAFNVKAPNAKPWGVHDPKLYEARVLFESDDESMSDSMSQRFGFRFFTVGEKDGDKRYYLNGKRVFLLAAMTRGFWPKNGIFPTPEMAVRDMKTCIEMGHNMMLYHRAIGQPVSMDVADEMGVMTYEEPGGYLCRPKPTEFAKQWRREKLRRMVIRDRSRPSMMIFNLDDLSYEGPNEDDERNIRMVHELDPSRPVTYNCITKPTIPNDEDYPFKLHMLPYDDTFYYKGWTSPYHLVRIGGYIDEYYRNPRYYLRYVIDPVQTMGDSLHPMPRDEIIFFGEEGSVGSMVRLEKIRNELFRTGAHGWREQEHLNWFDSYARFLDESGFRSSFPRVDDLTLAMGEITHYFHGRIIENVRISNKADAYVTNGWASAGTRSDIVDAYRNPTGDPAILQHYTQPLYVAVKIRDKVLPCGSIPIADIYIVNEANLRGRHTLTLDFETPDGSIIDTQHHKVSVKGGEEFGQLLVERVVMPAVTQHGYYTLSARITDRKGTVRADGYDDIYAVDYKTGTDIAGTTAVIDTSGTVQTLLKEARGMTVKGLDPYGPFVDRIVLGAHDFNTIRGLGRKKNMRSWEPILERVANGTTLIVLEHADRWVQTLGISLRYYGSENRNQKGRFLIGSDCVFNDLPKDQSMSWEYQTFYNGNVNGLRIGQQGVETLVAIGAENTDTFLNALCRVPFGEGHVILSTLRILPSIESGLPQNSIAKKLLLNLIEK
ncbi:glycoside hydrolase family 2 protein [Candidatus Latescibacterota bacterium]